MVAVDDIYGWRARIGLINMDSGWAIEAEFHKMAPGGVSVHTTLIRLPSATVDGLAQIVDSPEVEHCTEFLATAPLHVICFDGTSATFLHGLGTDEKIMDRMRSRAKGIPVTTTSTASP